MDPLADFQGDLDRLADLSDADLQDLESRLVDAFDAADSGGDDTGAGQLADALDTVRGEISKRSSAPSAEPVAAPAPAVAASAEPSQTPATPEAPATPATPTEPPPAESPAPEQTPDGPTAPAPSEGDQPSEAPAPASPSDQGEAVTSSTTVVTEPEVPADRAPVVPTTASAIVAGANLPGIAPGQTIDNIGQLAQAMARRIEVVGKAGGDGEQVLVASIRNEIPESRTLKYGDPFGNRDKIAEATSIDTIVAAGGCCAPLTTRYDLFGVGDTDRPVKASLAGFGADRGGIRFFEGPTLDAIGAAVGFWTCADDAAVDAADPATWKVCARVDCPDESESLVQAVTLCLTFGVMQSRVFPEMVTANNKLALVAQARLSESALLSQIKAQSKAVTGGTVEANLSFLRTLLDTVDRANAYYRSRHRISRQVPLRATFPIWVLDAIDADIVRQPPSTADLAENFGLDAGEVQSFFSDRNINVTWTLDTPNPATNGGGQYANIAATGGAIPAFPANFEWSLSMEGQFLFLDGGQLDLGIVRDSTLVRTNDYQTFTETFESVARVGGEALWVTTPVATTGRYAGPIQGGTVA